MSYELAYIVWTPMIHWRSAEKRLVPMLFSHPPNYSCLAAQKGETPTQGLLGTTMPAGDTLLGKKKTNQFA